MRINKDETMSNLRQVMDWKALDVAENVIDRVDEFEEGGLYDEIIQGVNDIVYTDDLWDIITNYITPDEVGAKSFDDVMGYFIEDIFNNCVVDYE